MSRLDEILKPAWGASNITDLPSLNQSDAAFVAGQLDEHLAPPGRMATDDEIARMIAATGSVLPQRGRDAGEATIQLRTFRKAVEDIPKSILERAFHRAIKELEWFPPPSKIREFAGQEDNRRQNRIFIMERLLAKAGLREWPWEREKRLGA